jgi:hypothetical protein
MPTGFIKPERADKASHNVVTFLDDMTRLPAAISFYIIKL